MNKDYGMMTLGERTTMNVSMIVNVVRFCLTTSFRYDNQHYKQLDGVTMGSPVSTVVADIFMEEFEEKALLVPGIGPRMWKRFVEDAIAVIKKENINSFWSISINRMRRLNSLWRKKELAQSHLWMFGLHEVPGDNLT